MTSTPLLLTLAILTATILILFVLWLSICYVRTRHAQHRLQLDHDAAHAAASGERSIKL